MALLRESPAHLGALRLVQSLELPDCWLGAGFIRNLIWDHRHGIRTPLSHSDIDVVFFGRSRKAEQDRILQEKLRTREPSLDWSVTNQAWIHEYNGDSPYGSTRDAIERWPETATCLAARLTSAGEIELFSAFGFEDAYDLVLRPNPKFNKTGPFSERIKRKPWLKRWPKLRVIAERQLSNPRS
ncbi:MAG: nucleotidyltransferase family protein [Oligoflexia bacterium]|nr:nucleotidyltransferase family protein [Oligoflexia bacterium]